MVSKKKYKNGREEGDRVKKYKINWIVERFGESYTTAKSKKEARMNTEKGLDHDFQDIDFMGNWQIESIEVIKEADHEKPA